MKYHGKLCETPKFTTSRIPWIWYLSPTHDRQLIILFLYELQKLLPSTLIWTDAATDRNTKNPKVITFYFFLDCFFRSLLLAAAGVCELVGSASSRSAWPVDLMCSNSLLRDVNVCRHLWHARELAESAMSADWVAAAATLLCYTSHHHYYTVIYKNAAFYLW